VQERESQAEKRTGDAKKMKNTTQELVRRTRGRGTSDDVKAAFAAWKTNGGDPDNIPGANIYLSKSLGGVSALLDASQSGSGNAVIIGDGRLNGTGGNMMVGGSGNDLLIGGAGVTDVLFTGNKFESANDSEERMAA
jgi:hypothetical protein